MGLLLREEKESDIVSITFNYSIIFLRLGGFIELLLGVIGESSSFHQVAWIAHLLLCRGDGFLLNVGGGVLDVSDELLDFVLVVGENFPEDSLVDDLSALNLG